MQKNMPLRIERMARVASMAAGLALGWGVPAAAESPLAGRVIRMAEDAGEWPPYTYYERVDGKPTRKVIGYSVDVVDRIMNRHGLAYEVELLPWKRVMTYLDAGGDYLCALNATWSPEREQNYLLSRPYYETTAHYFYSKKRYPHGLPIRQISDLRNYKAGGMLGYNYSHYGMEPGQVDDNAKNLTQLMAKLHAGRIDVALENIENVVGYCLTVSDVLADGTIGYAPVPGIEPVKFHMLFPKSPSGAELKRIIDEGIEQMEASGELERLLRKYVAAPNP
jgi:polar amino acid transport system substrate-binding protein